MLDGLKAKTSNDLRFSKHVRRQICRLLDKRLSGIVPIERTPVDSLDLGIVVGPTQEI